jgi:hypothetical protein
MLLAESILLLLFRINNYANFNFHLVKVSVYKFKLTDNSTASMIKTYNVSC